ncbi:hypothetical protein VP01_1568g1 [Puccinia sorghi]|uniref:Uncharacterized protein n=1 Tax=Puccinia sorghi TaxID=27349 RepID=A0A0L6VHX7_9BASI|nr:hypothetical protein VP01_1568g1 [Puccinia sorghi]
MAFRLHFVRLHFVVSANFLLLVQRWFHSLSFSGLAVLVSSDFSVLSLDLYSSSFPIFFFGCSFVIFLFLVGFFNFEVLVLLFIWCKTVLTGYSWWWKMDMINGEKWERYRKGKSTRKNNVLVHAFYVLWIQDFGNPGLNKKRKLILFTRGARMCERPKRLEVSFTFFKSAIFKDNYRQTQLSYIEVCWSYLHKDTDFFATRTLLETTCHPVLLTIIHQAKNKGNMYTLLSLWVCPPGGLTCPLQSRGFPVKCLLWPESLWCSHCPELFLLEELYLPNNKDEEEVGKRLQTACMLASQIPSQNERWAPSLPTKSFLVVVIQPTQRTRGGFGWMKRTRKCSRMKDKIPGR